LGDASVIVDSSEDAVRYVLNNPVRKGLVEVWDQYPYAAIVDPWY